MDGVFTILNRVLRTRGLESHATSALVVHRAREWIAERLPDLAGSVHVRSFHNGTILIDCANSVALQECRGVTEQMIRYLAQECSFASVKDVRVQRQ